MKADSVESFGVDLRTRVMRLGVNEKRRKKCKFRFSLIKKNQAFQKNYMKVGGQEFATSWYGSSKNVGAHAVEMAPRERF